MVTYSGSSTYSGATGTAEAFTQQGHFSLNTTPSVSGFTATDSASVTGTRHAYGTVTSRSTRHFASGTLVAATATPTGVGEWFGAVNLHGTLAAGDYYFMVTYSGDGTYLGATAPLSVHDQQGHFKSEHDTKRQWLHRN